MAASPQSRDTAGPKTPGDTIRGGGEAGGGGEGDTVKKGGREKETQ